MNYREITPDDMQSIFDVRVATWHNPNGVVELDRLGITHASVRQLMASSHRGWLCETGEGVAGFALGNKLNGEMWVIAVLSEYENRGIGKSLLARVEDWLGSEGWRETWLTTDTDEELRAVGFYRHLGWVDWKIEDGDRFMKKHIKPSTGAQPETKPG